jgi:hypothetical protein
LQIIEKQGEFISFQTSYRSSHSMLTTESTLRFPSLENVQMLIAQSGLVVRELLGDWDASPFASASSREMIFIAEISA